MKDGRKADFSVVSSGKIKALGMGEGYKEYLEEGVHVIDAEGKTVLPGFIDNHFHLVKTAVSEKFVDLSKARNFQEIGEKIKEAIKESPDGIIAKHLDWSNLEEQTFPDRTVLDKFVNDAPVVIYSFDTHVMMLNTYAILYHKVPFTLPGVDLDEKGMPTGVFHKQTSGKLDTDIHKSFEEEYLQSAIDQLMPKLLSCGLTTVAAIEGGNLKTDFDSDVDGDYVYKHGDQYPISLVQFYQTTNIEKVREMGMNRIGGALYLDGTIGDRTAALTFDYKDSPGKRGITCFDQEFINEFVLECVEKNLQIAFDAIGDDAIEAAIVAFENANKQYDIKHMRHRIEHGELITKAQMKRAADLGIILSMQPTYEGKWGMPGGMYTKRLGDRYGSTNMFKELFEEKVLVCGGSDSDVTEYNPLIGIHHAVNHPVEKHSLSLEEALSMYTSNGAYALFQEDYIGTLEEGKNADIVVLDCDLESLPKEKIKDAKVLWTIKDGSILYQRSNDAEN